MHADTHGSSFLNEFMDLLALRTGRHVLRGGKIDLLSLRRGKIDILSSRPEVPALQNLYRVVDVDSVGERRFTDGCRKYYTYYDDGRRHRVRSSTGAVMSKGEAISRAREGRGIKRRAEVMEVRDECVWLL